MFKIHHEKSVIIKKRRAAWIKAINRENFVVRVFTAVCSLHFHSGKTYFSYSFLVAVKKLLLQENQPCTEMRVI